MALCPPESLLSSRLEVNEFAVNENFRDYLLGEGLISFRDYFSRVGEKAMREVPGRLTVSVSCAEQKVYLKRHWQKGVGSKKRGPHYEAMSEWESTNALQTRGF